MGITTQCEAGYKAALNQRLHIEFALMKLSFLKNGVPSVGQAGVSTSSSAVKTPAGSRTASDPSHASMGPSLSRAEGGTSPQGSSPSSPAVIERSEAGVSGWEKPARPEVAKPEKQPEESKTRRKTVKTGASLSLKSILEEPEVQAAPAEDSAAAKATELTDEEIATKWKGLADLYPGQPRLANTIANAKLETSRENDELTVTFKVTNESQRSWIEAHKLHELEGHLQKALGRAGIKLLVGTEQFEEEKIIYTPEDKAKYLMENVPEVIDIISDLGLDLK